MGFKSGASQLTLEQALTNTRTKERLVRQTVVDIRDASLAGDISRNKIMLLPTTIADALDVWNAAAAVTGISQYTKDQVADQALNVVTQFNTMVAEATSVRNWIIANFPANAGFLLERSFDANGRMVLGTLSTAQTAGLRTELNKLIAAIDA